MPQGESGPSDGSLCSPDSPSVPSFFKGAGRRKLMFIDKETCSPFFAQGYRECARPCHGHCLASTMRPCDGHAARICAYSGCEHIFVGHAFTGHPSSKF